MSIETAGQTGARSVVATARWAAALNILSAVPDGFSVSVVRKLFIRGDAAATAANILGSERLFRFGPRGGSRSAHAVHRLGSRALRGLQAREQTPGAALSDPLRGLRVHPITELHPRSCGAGSRQRRGEPERPGAGSGERDGVRISQAPFAELQPRAGVWRRLQYRDGLS